jgi:hypothetical protein
MMRDEFEEGGSKRSGEGACALEHFLEYKHVVLQPGSSQLGG